jgi:hypothetical protein
VLVYADVDRGIVKQVVIEPQEAAWGGPWILFHTGATKAGKECLSSIRQVFCHV